MAATALQVLVSPLLETVFDRLTSLVEKEFKLISEANDEFESLSGILSTIKDVIEDAEEKQLTDKPICNWLRKLKGVTYDVDDFLDECKTDAALRNSLEILKPSSRHNSVKEFITGSVPYFFCFKPSSSSCRTIAKRVQSFIHRFDEIAKQRSQFHLNTYVTAADFQLNSRNLRETSSYTDEPEVYGREEDIEYIVHKLQSDAGENDRQGDVSVFAIVGMGGLGKTTLAQKVYHDQRIRDHFAIKCWICVSEDFCSTRFIKIILTSLGEKVEQDQTLDQLQNCLREKLHGKKFLVVLDDVWNQDQGKWETLKTPLSCGEKGSFIVVTTRLRTVASMMATVPHYLPKTLSEEDCWNLFKQRAFMCDDENNFPELVATGREIVKKCSGIPLAAKALGGLLRFKREHKQWLNVNDSQIWELEDYASDAILPALQLSYKHLSSQLKQCFAYCCIYKKNYSISKEELISSWIGHGFIQSKGEIMDLEDVGNEIFDELSWGSFFQNFEGYGDGITCKMHDLVHDLACAIMRDECLILHLNKNNNHVGSTTTSTRFVSLNDISISDYPFLKTELHQNHIRELNLHHPLDRSNIPTFLEFIFSNLKFLRVLNLEYLFISTIPESIGNLKHLRYLKLSSIRITSLPNEICSLINLEILKLRDCSHLLCLPTHMRRLTNLRHLDITECNKLTRMPIEMGKLTSLRTLGLFIVGKESGCGITELKDLQRLKGSLSIHGLEHVRDATDARKSNLILRHHLESLNLCWSSGLPDTEEEEQAQLLVGDGLQPHPNIEFLSINGYGGVMFPHWIGTRVSSCLPNLVNISLKDCFKCEHLPQLGELSHLAVLQLDNLDSVKCTNEFYHHGDPGVPFFPSLKRLYIENMYHFGEISSPSSLSRSSSSQSLSSNQAEVSSYPCLQHLKIHNCPKLASFISLPPSLDILELHNIHEELLMRYLKESPSSLSSLDVGGFPSLVSLPVGEVHEEEGLVNLTHLSVQNKGSRHLANLRRLTICACPKLEFSHEDDADFQNLISLRYVGLNGLEKLTYLPPFPLLTSLEIGYCSALATLRDWMPNLTSLRSLRIYGCDNLESLSDRLQQLTALTNLDISSCKNLKSLPDEGLELLTSLRSLCILDCHPDLHSQCMNEQGHYWDKISHIPDISIFRYAVV